MLDRNKIYLKQAAMLCLARCEYKVAFFCSRYSTVKYLLEYVESNHEDFSDVYIKHKTGEIFFPNGSKIVIYAPQSVQGIEVHKVIFDEQDSIPYELKQHLRTRERLK